MEAARYEPAPAPKGASFAPVGSEGTEARPKRRPARPKRRPAGTIRGLRVAGKPNSRRVSCAIPAQMPTLRRVTVAISAHVRARSGKRIRVTGHRNGIPTGARDLLEDYRCHSSRGRSQSSSPTSASTSLRSSEMPKIPRLSEKGDL